MKYPITYGIYLILILIVFPNTNSYPLESRREGRIWDILGLGEFFGTCAGYQKMCGEFSPTKKDCCNQWVCRLSMVDQQYYCMANIPSYLDYDLGIYGGSYGDYPPYGMGYPPPY